MKWFSSSVRGAVFTVEFKTVLRFVPCGDENFLLKQPGYLVYRSNAVGNG